jgi:lysophospholipase L1-like esterase
MSRRQAGRWLLVVASLLGSLAVAEVAFRAFWIKRATVASGLEDPHFHHRPRPYSEQRYTSPEFDATVRTNRFGLRGPDPAIPKPSGTLRLLVLGDSYTVGYNVREEETFAALIEQRLRARGLPVEVINAGVSGYSPLLHYISLRDQYLQFEPDLVILWYDLGDLQDDYRYQKNLIRDGTGAIVRCDPRYVHGRWSLREWLMNHSALAKYLDVKLVNTARKVRVLGLRGYLEAKLRGERAKVAISRLKASQRADDLLETERFLFARDYATPKLIAPYWEISAGYLRLIRDLLTSRRIPLVIGIYPYGMLAGPNQWGEGRTFWGFERGRTYDASLFQAIFERFAREERLPLLDTFPRFREAAAREKLFYDWDGHFTPAGHRVVADATAADGRLLTLLRTQRARQAARTAAANAGAS